MKRKPFLGFVVSVLAVGAIALGGCVGSTPRYYSLASVKGQPLSFPLRQADGQMVTTLEVRTPSVAGRLDRDRIVRGTTGYQMNLADGAAWSEPLADMIGHTLAANLAQRLPETVVFSQNDSVATPPQVIVELSIGRFETDTSGYAVMDGVLSVHKASQGEERARSIPVHWVSVHPIGSGAGALVQALSEGAGVLADRTVHLLQR